MCFLHFFQQHDTMKNTPLAPSQPSNQSYKCDSVTSHISLPNVSDSVCRICHCESETGAPLISPCLCSGSMKYVHQACLQKWIKSADTKSCELCQFDFHMTTRVKPFRNVGLKILFLLCSLLIYYLPLYR